MQSTVLVYTKTQYCIFIFNTVYLFSRSCDIVIWLLLYIATSGNNALLIYYVLREKKHCSLKLLYKVIATSENNALLIYYVLREKKHSTCFT